jgi:hypothetical protein
MNSEKAINWRHHHDGAARNHVVALANDRLVCSGRVTNVSFSHLAISEDGNVTTTPPSANRLSTLTWRRIFDPPVETDRSSHRLAHALSSTSANRHGTDNEEKHWQTAKVKTQKFTCTIAAAFMPDKDVILGRYQ